MKNTAIKLMLLFLLLLNIPYCQKDSINNINCNYYSYQSIGLISDTIRLLEKTVINLQKEYFTTNKYVVNLYKTKSVLSCSLDVNITGRYFNFHDTLFLIYKRPFKRIDSNIKNQYIVEKYLNMDSAIELVDMFTVSNLQGILFRDIISVSNEKAYNIPLRVPSSKIVLPLIPSQV